MTSRKWAAEPDSTATPGPPVRPLRRLAIIFYDVLLLLAVLFLAGTLALFADGGFIGDVSRPLPLPSEREAWTVLAERLWYLCVIYLYYVWFWTRGQTLGMRAWGTRITDLRGARPDWKRASLRFVVGCLSLLPLALGYLWSCFDGEYRTWYDLASGTRLSGPPGHRSAGGRG